MPRRLRRPAMRARATAAATAIGKDVEMNRIGLIAGGLVVALVIAASTLFIVDQRSMAVIYALGEIKEVVVEPGLKAKLPPPFQNVVFLDRRVQTLDSPET